MLETITGYLILFLVFQYVWMMLGCLLTNGKYISDRKTMFLRIVPFGPIIKVIRSLTKKPQTPQEIIEEIQNRNS